MKMRGQSTVRKNGNVHKSEMFVSPNTRKDHKALSRLVLGIGIVFKPWLYLGSTLDLSCGKGVLFYQTIDRFRSHLGKVFKPFYSIILWERCFRSRLCSGLGCDDLRFWI